MTTAAQALNSSSPSQSPLNVANFAIAGTEKAGTTSVFSYLSQHPDVSGSVEKETDFFRHNEASDIGSVLQAYSHYFSQDARAAKPIIMEASPGYLGSAERVADQLQRYRPDMKLLFILRDPVDRIYSSFNFHKNRLDLPDSLQFDEYLSLCHRYEAGESAQALGIDDWYLKTLQYGNYSNYLEIFQRHLPADNIKVMFFEDLRADVMAFMLSLSEFLSIDSGFWEDYSFESKNVTFAGKHVWLHKLALYVNSRAERMLRQRPELKQAIVGAYKKMNQSHEGYESMSPATRTDLADYYSPANERLQALLGTALPENWGEMPRTS